MSTAVEQPAKPKTKRILELDAIRALSCLNLLLFHFIWVYQEKYGFNSPLGFTFPYGKYGVQLFFMLSGLVNAMTLISKRKPGDFLAARCIRILPSYWLMITLSVILFAFVPFYQVTPAVDSTVANITAMPMLFGYSNMEPVTWTLQIEMLFYVFLMTLLVTGFLDKPLRSMITAVSICLVCCTTFSWFKTAYPGSEWNGTFKLTEDLFFMRNLPLFAMGILLNELRCKRGKAWALWIGIVISGCVFHAIDLRGHNPAATVLMFGLLTASAFGRVPILRWKPLIFIGFISYSLYLFHNNLGSLLMHLLEMTGCPPLVAVISATAFSIGLGAAVTYWFEQPITKKLLAGWHNLKPRLQIVEGNFVDQNTETVCLIKMPNSTQIEEHKKSNLCVDHRTMNLKFITDFEQLDADQAKWDSVAGSFPFFQWNWLGNWFRFLGNDLQLAVLVAHDDEGKWLGVAPWCIDSTGIQTKLRFLGSGEACSDYLNLISASEAFEQFALAATDWLVENIGNPQTLGRIDVVELEGITPTCDESNLVCELIAANGLKLHSTDLEGGWATELPASWPELNSSFSKSMRRKTKKAVKRVADSNTEVLSTKERPFDELWPIFTELHQQRRKMLGQSGCFADSRFEKFLKSATASMIESGHAELIALKFEGKPLATMLIFNDDDSVYTYQTGMDVDRLDLEPGYQICYLTFMRSIENGFKRLDFLRGDDHTNLAGTQNAFR